MNRFRKEENRKYQQARAGLSELEIKRLDREEMRQRMVFELARSIHEEWFPEEYDYLYDSIAEAEQRKNGVNPMSEDYITDVGTKRKTMKVNPLTESGKSANNDTWKIAYNEAEARIKIRGE